MQYGIIMFPTDYAMDPVSLARAVEERGFDLLLLPEHTHIPASRESPWPGGAELPRDYSHTLDPFGALAGAAAVTERLLLGTGICLVPERDPIHLAKEVATVDQLSNGRFLFGVGAGWNAEELANHGVAFKQRWGVMRERIEACKALWTQEEASYHGRHVDFDRVWQWPKPVQQPHPPILVGGDGERTLQRVVRYGDEWMPIAAPGRFSPERLQARQAELKRLASDAGRGDIPVSLFFCPTDADTIKHYRDLGVTRVSFSVPAKPAAEVLPALDRLAALRDSL